MSDLFNVFSVSGSALDTYNTWLNAISDNVANADDVSPTSGPAFQARYVEAQAVPGGPTGTGQGVTVSGIGLGSATGIEVYDPSSPLADTKGMVREPDIDMGEQMTDMMQAQQGYEANLAVVSRAQAAYQAALTIGQGA
jgi:flagellar basal-body rod protein FlgC